MFAVVWICVGNSKVAPLEQHADNTAVLEAGLAEEVQRLGGMLFGEVAKSAEDIWRRVYYGKTEVTYKALSPLRTLHAKLTGLSFVEPHVAPCSGYRAGCTAAHAQEGQYYRS